MVGNTNRYFLLFSGRKKERKGATEEQTRNHSESNLGAARCGLRVGNLVPSPLPPPEDIAMSIAHDKHKRPRRSKRNVSLLKSIIGWRIGRGISLP